MAESRRLRNRHRQQRHHDRRPSGLDVYGALNIATGATTNNSVTITGGSVGRSVYGSLNYNGNSISNSVAITNVAVAGDIYGNES